jgi:hypothetical protein
MFLQLNLVMVFVIHQFSGLKDVKNKNKKIGLFYKVKNVNSKVHKSKGRTLFVVYV